MDVTNRKHSQLPNSSKKYKEFALAKVTAYGYPWIRLSTVVAVVV